MDRSVRSGLEIAVIGMSLRFPGATNKNEFWDCLTQGKETIHQFADEELIKMGVRNEMLENPNYVKSNGIIDLDESFDSELFRYTAEDTNAMHPQTRKLHECVYEALEDAGYNPYQYKGEIGFYAGMGSSTMWELNVALNKSNVIGRFSSSFLSDTNYGLTNIAYKLNLRGPIVQVKSACSSSLVALHTSCRSLLAGECDMAVAGGATIAFGNRKGYLYEDGSVYSNDGHCRPFDLNAIGTVPSDGVGVVILKRLEKAVQDGDHVYAVIKGSAVNGDGSQKVGYTAPGLRGEARVIRDCLQFAGVDAGTIDYIEAHGTGTRLGDTVEIDALNLIYRGLEKASCAIGSVKGNIGHLDSASGIAGFIKMVLCLYHKAYVPSLFYCKSSSDARFAETPFYVNTEYRPWNRRGHNRRGALSSYGVGGTNAHVILEEYIPDEASNSGSCDELILLSAMNQAARSALINRFAEQCSQQNNYSLHDIAFTLQTGRAFYPQRAFVVASSIDEAEQCILNGEKNGLFIGSASHERGFVFMFPGQGNQYRNIARGLYRTVRRFKEEMDQCFHILSDQGFGRIKELLYPEDEIFDPIVDQYDVSSVITFIIEYSLANTLIAQGIRPSYLVGHSVGEYVSACIAGVFSLYDAIRMVLYRGKLMNTLPEGKMIAVPMQYKELEAFIGGHPVSIAADHGYTCLVAGSIEAIDEFVELLQERRVIVQELGVHIAGHTEVLKCVSDEYDAFLKTVHFAQGNIPVVSSYTGKVVAEEMSKGEYWIEQMTAPVFFAQSIQTILATGNPYLFVEVGAGSVLSRIVQYIYGTDKEMISFNTVRHSGEQITDDRYLIKKIGTMWLHGGAVDWSKYNKDTTQKRVPACTYPFQYIPYPYKYDLINVKEAANRTGNTRRELKDWYYIPTWKRKLLSREEQDTNNQFIVIFMGESNFERHLVAAIKQGGHRVVCIYCDEEFELDSEGSYHIDPQNEEHFALLLNALRKQGFVPNKYFFTWGLRPVTASPASIGPADIERAERLGIYSVINLAKTLGKSGNAAKCEIGFLTDDVQKAFGSKVLYPEMATVLGAISTIPAEYPNIHCKSIDVSSEDLCGASHDSLVEALAQELSICTQSKFILYRNGQRLVNSFDPIEIRSDDASMRFIGNRKVYLFIGGFGGIGYELMRHVSEYTSESVFIVLQRSSPVEVDQEKSCAIEKNGNMLCAFSVDISDESAVDQVFRRIYEEYRAIHGVFFCAGSDEGSLIHNLTSEVLTQAFAAKVYGSLNVHRHIRRELLDFYFFCSSFNVYKSSAGTVGYTAANRFIDAYANYLSDCFAIETKCINWYAWKDVGGAVRYAKKMFSGPVNSSADDYYPHIQKLEPKDGYAAFATSFQCDTSWVLTEHRVNGRSVLPGTVYIDLIASYIHEHFNMTTFRLFDMYCITPLSIDREACIEVRITKSTGDSYEFVMESGEEGRRVINFQGHFDFKLSNETLKDYYQMMQDNKVEGRREDFSIGQKKQNVEFGKRWTSSVTSYTVGQDSGEVCLKLSDEYQRDLDKHYLHPALLDLSLCTLSQEDGLFLPFYYKNIYVYGRIPQRVESIAKLCERSNDAVSYSYTIYDDRHRPLVLVEDYTLVRTPPNALSLNNKGEGASALSPKLHEVEMALEEGLSTAEGIEVFHNFMNCELNHATVCPNDIYCEFSKGLKDVSPLMSSSIATTKQRKSNAIYIEPKDDIEARLAKIWEMILGVKQIGINDNYFELGANSLRIIQFNQLAQQELNREIPIVSYYMNPTIKTFSAYLLEKGERPSPGIETTGQATNDRNLLKHRRNTLQG